MYIKQVTIQGLFSFGNQTVIGPFSPKHNVIVGKNGSGKSDVINAIQLVIELNDFDCEDWPWLRHGPLFREGFIEVIFDNCNCIPIEKEEVTLRRVIGSKKDQYFLDKKMVTKTDVINLLESAGFLLSKPYYIVKQGMIKQIATGPDYQKLQLLSKVAGTCVYDERQAESRVILKETEYIIEKIKKLLEYIEERLQTLKEEKEGRKEELKQYHKWDVMRRSLEYTIHNQELTDTRKKLNELASKCENSVEMTKTLRGAQEGPASKRIKLASIGENSGEGTNTLRQDTQEESSKQIKSCIRDQLEKLDSTIQQKQMDLEQIMTRYYELEKEEESCTARLQVCEQRRTELLAKQGQGNQFTTQDDRDKWIREELKSLNKAIKDKEEQISHQRDDIASEMKNEDLETRMGKLNSDIKEMEDSVDLSIHSHCDQKKRKDELQNEQNSLWRQTNSIQQEIATTKDELRNKEQKLHSTTSKAVLRGIDSVKRVLDTFRSKGLTREMEGYHGMLIENFQCASRFNTCTEITAGNRLFYHIVDTDVIRDKILAEMNNSKMPGVATFFMLNRLEDTETQYPESPDASPMLHNLQFDPKLKAVMNHVFGKTLICSSLDVAMQFSKTHNLDWVTLEGYQLICRVAITSRSYKAYKSKVHRVELQSGILELRQKLSREEQECKELHKKLQQVKVEVTQLMSEMQRMYTKYRKNKWEHLFLELEELHVAFNLQLRRDVYEKMKSDMRIMKEESQVIQRALTPKERRLSSLITSLEAMKGSAQSLDDEIGTDLLSHLSEDDQREVDSLNDEIKMLNQQNKQALADRVRLEGEKNKIQNLLSGNLMRKREGLVAKLQKISIEDCKQNLDTCLAELQGTEMSIETNNACIVDFESQNEPDTKALEKTTNEQHLLLKKKEECMRKICELGSLPSDAFEKYTHLSLEQLLKELEQCNSELMKYSHINKKALDQFVSFSDQKDRLISHKEEVDKGHASIRQLMNVMELRKCEALHLTFKQVSKYFSEAFSKLVPAGKATLFMKNTDGEFPLELERDSSQAGVPLVGQLITGVGIKVSFSGKTSETRGMWEISSGQKSLVALTLLFAVQKCDPAPIYILDLVDCVIDAQHNKSVAGE